MKHSKNSQTPEESFPLTTFLEINEKSKQPGHVKLSKDFSTDAPSPESVASESHPQHPGQNASLSLQSLVQSEPSAVDPLVGLNRTLEARANKLQLLLRPAHTQLRPPAAGRRIYSEDEIALATSMFHKLQYGEERRPRARPYRRPPASNKNIDDLNDPIDPLDRVADVLLDLFEL